MDSSLEVLEEIDPWHPNLNRVTVSLKEGLDLNKLSTVGADLEIESKYNAQEEEEEGNEEEEAEKELFYQRQVLKHLNPECADFFGNDSEDEDEQVNSNSNNMTPFAKMALEMEDLTGDGGVLKKTLDHGIGPVVPPGAMVRVHYNGYLEYCDEPYDSSRLRGKEQEFKLGRGDVIPGWDLGVATMKKTELARFLIHSSYAYGSLGCPPRIPPNAIIMFEIEVVSFVDMRAVDEFEVCSKEEKEKISFDKLVDVTNAIREEGNDFFHQNIFSKASHRYRKAIRILEERRLQDEKEETEWKAILIKLYLNQSLCHLRMHKPKPTITLCRKVLQFDEKNVKAVFRLGQAYMQLSEFGKSRKYLIRAGRLSPSNVEIRQELAKLDKAVKKFKVMEKSICSKMFPSAAAEKPLSAESSDDQDEDSIPPEKLKEYEDLYKDKFSMLSSNPHMMELTVPLPFSGGEQALAETIASEMELHTEMIPGVGLRVYKELPPEVEAFINP